jgi:carbon-monoxide dehydrogenase medium subunit
LKVPQSASGFAVVGVATQIRITGGACEDICIGVTGLAPKAFRAASAEAALRGRTLDEATVSAAAARADVEAEDAMEDIHASGDYRRHLARVYVRRAVEAAAART